MSLNCSRMVPNISRKRERFPLVPSLISLLTSEQFYNVHFFVVNGITVIVLYEFKRAFHREGRLLETGI